MKENKEKVLATYAAMIESKHPGKGAAERQIVEKYWDEMADGFADPERLTQMGYKIDERFTFNCVKGIAARHPAIINEIKALRS